MAYKERKKKRRRRRIIIIKEGEGKKKGDKHNNIYKQELILSACGFIILHAVEALLKIL